MVVVRGWMRIIVNHLIRHLHRWHTVHPRGMDQLYCSDDDNVVVVSHKGEAYIG